MFTCHSLHEDLGVLVDEDMGLGFFSVSKSSLSSGNERLAPEVFKRLAEHIRLILYL